MTADCSSKAAPKCYRTILSINVFSRRVWFGEIYGKLASHDTASVFVDFRSVHLLSLENRMNFRKGIFTALLAVFSLLGPTKALAVWTTPAQVSYLNVWPSGFRFVLHQLTPDCPGGINQLYVDWTAPNAKALYAMLVVAFQSGDLVAANYGCDAVLGPTTSNIDVRKLVSW